VGLQWVFGNRGRSLNTRILQYLRPPSAYLSLSGLSGPIWAYLGLSGPIWAYLVLEASQCGPAGDFPESALTHSPSYFPVLEGSQGGAFKRKPYAMPMLCKLYTIPPCILPYLLLPGRASQSQTFKRKPYAMPMLCKSYAMLCYAMLCLSIVGWAVLDTAHKPPGLVRNNLHSIGIA